MHCLLLGSDVDHVLLHFACLHACMSACGPTVITLGSCLVQGGRNGLGLGFACGSCLCWPHQPACMPKCYCCSSAGWGARNPCSCVHETVHEDVAGEGVVHCCALRCERWGLLSGTLAYGLCTGICVGQHCWNVGWLHSQL